MPSSPDTSALLRLVAVGAAGAFLATGATALLLFGGRSSTPAPASPVAAPRADAAPTDGDARQRALALSRPPSLAVGRDVPTPRWIWASPQATPGQRVWFRTRYDRPGTLRLSCDNHAIVRVDGNVVARADDWQRPITVELRPSEGRPPTLEIEAWNDGGPAGLVALIEQREPDGRARWITSDASWEVADDAAFSDARPAVDLGPLGTPPWGAVPVRAGVDLDRDIAVLEGFDVELVYTVPREQGSWVSLTADASGRLVASGQSSGLYRLTPPRDGVATRVEPIDLPVGAAQGLACVGGDLYCVVNGNGASDGPGLYRLRDTDGDDRYDAYALVRAIPGSGGEHGPHAVVEGPDGLLYVVGGNHVAPPGPERSTVPRVWDEDLLLPRLWDANGHAVNILAPGGWICRTDPRRDDAEWELIAIGFRNPYDIAFNADGEAFTYDADMEWDMGAPWYRPTRVNHVVSGAEFGWRSGTGKWPTHYADSLPAVVDIGPGSPTGVVSGANAAFPRRYRDALFLLDWTFGAIHAVHLTSDGATYAGEAETFLTGRPLPLTDAVVSPVDGAMYFAVGGRGTASAVYRVRYVGAAPTDDAGAEPRPTPTARRRRALEEHHRPGVSDAALDEIIDHLADGDRFVRYAARVALEHQRPDRWATRVLADPRTRARLAGVMALARVDGAGSRQRLVETLWTFDPAALPRDERLELLRCWTLVFVRGGAPDAAMRYQLARRYETIYPTNDDATDRELCDLLVYLEAPSVVARTLPLMERGGHDAMQVDAEAMSRGASYGRTILAMAASPPRTQQVHYALALRQARSGWTEELRDRYFRWFESASQASGGHSFAGFLRAIRADALANVPAALRGRYETLAGTLPGNPTPAQRPRGPGRHWTVDEIVALAADGLVRRDFDRGRALFTGASCYRCHRLSGEGLAGGPDLSGIGNRFALRDLVETIIEPSRVVSDQYAQTELVLDDGQVLVGRVVDERDGILRVMTSMLAPDAVTEVEASRVASRAPSAVSAMMPGLLDQMAPGEVLDLLAFLLAGGDPRSPMFGESGDGAFVTLFDGRTLDGWTGEASRWSVESGEIVGRVTADEPLTANTFLIHDEPLPERFELRLEARLSGENNSGVQYLARVHEGFRATGYQLDLHPNPTYHGMLYEEGGRGIVTLASDAVRFAIGDWHAYTVIASGDRIEHRIDGTTVCVTIDDERPRDVGGDRLALQLHAGAPYEVRFRNIRVRAIR